MPGCAGVTVGATGTGEAEVEEALLAFFTTPVAEPAVWLLDAVELGVWTATAGALTLRA